MRTGILTAGIILIVISIILYVLPSGPASASTTTVTDGSAMTQTTSANFSIPPALTFGVFIVGLILLILGIALPGTTVSETEYVERETAAPVETSRTTVHERRVEHRRD